MEKINCNLCDSKKSCVFLINLTSWEHKGLFNLVKCCECGLVYLNPRPEIEAIGKYYPESDYWAPGTSGYHVKERQIGFDPLYKIIKSKKKKGNILDIGAGNGLFLSEFKDSGWNTVGTDISKKASNNAKKYFGINIKVGEFLNLKFNSNYFDVVTLNNSLEHLYYPKETLEKANKLLKKNGLIVITVPNIESFGFKIFQKNWHALQPPRHLFHFSENTLNMLLQKTGFKAEKYFYAYKVHAIYSLFESFRFMMSPKFEKAKEGGLTKDAKSYKSNFSLVKEMGKYFGYIFAYSVYCLEVMFKKPEVITVYAKKK